MGGRGASSGISHSGKKYGTEYKTLLTDGNIKFITKTSRTSETVVETMTEGRVYVTVGGDDILSVTYFDTDNKRVKTIDVSHPHKGLKPHVHHGYYHSENDTAAKGAAKLNDKEKIMLDNVKKIWYNRKSKG